MKRLLVVFEGDDEVLSLEIPGKVVNLQQMRILWHETIEIFRYSGVEWVL